MASSTERHVVAQVGAVDKYIAPMVGADQFVRVTVIVRPFTAPAMTVFAVVVTCWASVSPKTIVDLTMRNIGFHVGGWATFPATVRCWGDLPRIQAPLVACLTSVSGVQGAGAVAHGACPSVDFSGP